MRDQETGVRSYLISPIGVLTPYYEGNTPNRWPPEDIRRRLAHHADLLADLDAIETAAADWRTDYAEPVIAGVTPNAPNVVNGQTAERAARPNSTIYELSDAQNVHLLTARRACR